MSAGAINYTLGLNASPLLASLGLAKSAIGGFMGLAGKIGGLVGLTGGLGLAGAAALGFKKAIHEAADMETLSTSFEVLLGSVDAAKARMADLAKFAAATPFELPEIAAASRTLQTLTKGALATGAGLTLVGDVAAGTNQPFNELAVSVGRLYDGLQSGRAVGEALQRLQEIGVVSGDVRGQIERMQSAGMKGDKVWNVAKAALADFGGMMDKQSATWNGLFSTLRDEINAVFREFGTPVIDVLKPMLSSAIEQADTLTSKAHEWGAAFADGIRFAHELLSQGELGNFAALTLKAGFLDAAAALVDGIADGIVGIRDQFTAMFDRLAIKGAAIALQMGSIIKDAVAASLPGIGNTGKALKAGLKASADADRAGATGLNLALDQTKGMGPDLSFVTRPIKFLGESADKTRKELDKLKLSMSEKIESDARMKVEQDAIKEWQAGINNVGGKNKSKGVPADPLGKSNEKPLSDRLSKIGGFINTGGPAATAESIANNTRNLVGLTKQVLGVLMKPQIGPSVALTFR